MVFEKIRNALHRTEAVKVEPVPEPVHVVAEPTTTPEQIPVKEEEEYLRRAEKRGYQEGKQTEKLATALRRHKQGQPPEPTKHVIRHRIARKLGRRKTPEEQLQEEIEQFKERKAKKAEQVIMKEEKLKERLAKAEERGRMAAHRTERVLQRVEGVGTGYNRAYSNTTYNLGRFSQNQGQMYKQQAKPRSIVLPTFGVIRSSPSGRFVIPRANIPKVSLSVGMKIRPYKSAPITLKPRRYPSRYPVYVTNPYPERLHKPAQKYSVGAVLQHWVGAKSGIRTSLKTGFRPVKLANLDWINKTLRR